ncbi:hypothetical protein AAVH_16126 [Aphelenchoides avenae]|nr:hypothetical protein AAVH_16126 [Aphelenchus avenae]
MSLVTIVLLLVLPVWIRLSLAQDAPCAYWSDWNEVGCAEACGGCGGVKLERTCVVEPGCTSPKCEGPSSKVEESPSCKAAATACRYPRVICCKSHKPTFDPQLKNVTCTPKSGGQAPAPHVGKEDNEGIRRGGETHGPRNKGQNDGKDDSRRGGGHKGPLENGKDKPSVFDHRKGLGSDESSEEKRSRGSGKGPQKDAKPSRNDRGDDKEKGKEEQKGGKDKRRW